MADVFEASLYQGVRVFKIRMGRIVLSATHGFLKYTMLFTHTRFQNLTIKMHSIIKEPTGISLAENEKGVKSCARATYRKVYLFQRVIKGSPVKKGESESL